MLLPTLDREILPNYLSYPIGAKCLAAYFVAPFVDMPIGVRFNIRGVQPTALAEELRQSGSAYPVMRVQFLSDRKIELTVYGVTRADQTTIHKLLSGEALPRVAKWISYRFDEVRSQSQELSVFFVGKRRKLMYVDRLAPT